MGPSVLIHDFRSQFGLHYRPTITHIYSPKVKNIFSVIGSHCLNDLKFPRWYQTMQTLDKKHILHHEFEKTLSPVHNVTSPCRMFLPVNCRNEENPCCSSQRLFKHRVIGPNSLQCHKGHGYISQVSGHNPTRWLIWQISLPLRDTIISGSLTLDL